MRAMRRGRMRHCIHFFILSTAFVTAAPDLAFPGEKIDEWHGHRRHSFRFDDCDAWVVEPKQARSDLAWSWCMEFPDAFTDRCAAPGLLAAGLHHVHIKVGNTFGAPPAQMHFRAFHAELTKRGLAQRAVLIGISRGGLYSHRFASENPEKVSVIYGDAPVLDFKSWPGGKGKGKGSPKDWASLQQLYAFNDEAAALAYAGNPIDTLSALSAAKIALIYVVGDADDVVPFDENAGLAQSRYRALGGTVQIMHKPGVGHHPHGLDDSKPVIEFILQHLR
jgi:pimeloyl-ACP methyl ester carboxylesterase